MKILGWIAVTIIALMAFGYFYADMKGYSPYMVRGKDLSDDMAASTRDVIKTAGYACDDTVNRMVALPHEVEGRVAHAWCGPADDPSSVNSSQQYWIAVDVMTVRPWTDRPHQ